MILLPALAIMAAPVSSMGVTTEMAVEAPGPKGALRGTMLRPTNGGPMVLIIPGSGPTDRDGNNLAGVKAAPYKMLAAQLAKDGIGTIRADKRGMFGSAAAIEDANTVTIEDYAADAGAWIAIARQATQVPCVWLLGHSEGGLVGLVAARTQPDVCGLILVSTPGRPMGAVLREQLTANPANAPLIDEAFAAIATLESGKAVDTSIMHPALLPLFSPRVQPFLMNLLSQDPVKLAAAVSDKPMLIVQGERDIQVPVSDAHLLAKASNEAKLAILPGVNHVLKHVPSGDKAVNLRTYADPSLPLAPSVAAAIGEFIAENSR